MTTPGAAFSLNGNTGTDGYTATAGGVVNLALIDGMHADVQSVVARVVSKSRGASALDELATDYVFPTPSTVLALTIPDEVSSWWVEVKINGGSSARGVEPTWTASRIISTLGASGIRKQVPGESVQFDAANGWGGAQNDLVDALDTIAGGGTITPPASTDPFTGLGVTSEHRADAGVEHGARVSRWVDQRGAKHMDRIELGAATNIRPLFNADFGDGFPSVQFDGVSGLCCGLPIITSDVFSVALRVRLPASDIVVASCTQAYPGGNPDASNLIVGADYTAGGSTSITASLTDDAATTPVVASQSATHSAWHTVIVRSTGTTIRVRVDGTNGSTANTTPLGPIALSDVSSLGCVRDASDGASTGNFTGGYLRHLLVADGYAWSDAECLTVEAGLTAIWT